MAYEVEDNKTDNAFDDVVRQAQQNSTSGAGGDRPDGVTDL